MNCANHPDRERVAFCQNCGKALCKECARFVGSAVFCEPCLAARLAAAEAVSGTGPAAETPYGSVPPAEGATYPAAPVGVAPASVPNPVVALLLGFIPGVGAFYNGQYAKGVVHLIVFAVLTTLVDQNGIFLLFVFGWEFYQAIEAHHTARARRDGTPLPNPFGLNDIGERLGFGRAWPSGPASAGGTVTGAPPAAGYGTQSRAGEPPSAANYAAPQQPYTPPPPPPPFNWGAPTESYSYMPPVPTVLPSPPPARVPVGALVLIGLGVLFLIGNSGLFRGLPVHMFVPFLLIGIGVWIFFHKMTESGPSLADDGTPGYRVRLFRALRGAIWVILVGVLFLLNNFHILSWGRSWPLFIIVGGLMTFFERTVYSSAAVAASYAYVPPAPAAAAAGPARRADSTSIIPVSSHDEEGK